MKTSFFLKPALLLVVCLFLMNVQSCKDPLQGDIPRTLELVSNGDWQQVEGITGGSVYSLAASGSTILITSNVGLFRSVDNGFSWLKINTTSDLGLSPNMRKIIAIDSTFVSTADIVGGQAIVRSQDFGQTWQPVATRIPLNSETFFVVGSTLLAGNFLGEILRSIDKGLSWTRVQSSTTDNITSFTKIGNTIFAGTPEGKILYSVNDGLTWQMLSTTLPKSGIMKLTSIGNTLFAATGQGLYKSANAGMTWVLLRSEYITSIATMNSSLLIGTGSGVLRTNDEGSTWAEAQGLSESNVTMLTGHNSTLFAGRTSGSGGIARSTDGGTTWQVMNNGLLAAQIAGITATNNFLFVSFTQGGILRSQDNGITWTSANSNLSMDGNAGRTLATLTDVVFTVKPSIHSVYRSSNNGEFWEKTSFTAIDTDTPSSVIISGNRIFVGSTYSLASSRDDGNTWTYYRPSYLPNQPILFKDAAFQESTIVAASGYGILRSTDDGITWVTSNTGIDFGGASPYITNVVASKSSMVTAASRNIYYSRNKGASWQANIGAIALQNGQARALLTVNDSTFLAGTYSNGVFRSTDYGVTWTPINTGTIIPQGINKLYLKGNNLFAGTDNNGLYRLPLR